MAFNGRFAINVAQFAAKQGADETKLLASLGLSFNELCQEDCKITDDQYNNLVEEAVRESTDPCFGLHIGENLSLAAAGLIAQITQSASSVKEALAYCIEFANLGCSVLPMSMHDKGSFYQIDFNADIQWREKSKPSYIHTSDGVMAFSIREFTALSQNEHSPIKVLLPWDREDKRAEYERVFSCPVEFNANSISLQLKKEHVEQKILSSDYELLRILVEYAEKKRRTEQSSIQDKVEQSVLNLLKPEFPGIMEVASHLNMSSRSLQRKLKQEGSSYSIVVEKIKKDLAIDYLKREDLSISEVAYLLDYAESSSFIRSFKRWTGSTPNSFRVENGSKNVS